MNELKAPSLNSLLGSDRGSTDSLLAESLLDMEEVYKWPISHIQKKYIHI